MYRVLIVDDEKMIRNGIRQVIPWKQLEVGEIDTVGSAAEALRLVEEKKPDLIITDISMPEMDGLDLIERIRSSLSHVKIIVLTGYDRFDYARQALKLQVQDFLLKPIDEEELTESIRRQFTQLGEERAAAQEKLDRTEGLRRQWQLDALIKRLKDGEPLDEAGERDLEEMGIMENQKLQIGILFPGVEGNLPTDEKNFRIRSIQNICMGMLDKQNRGLTVEDRQDRILLVLFGGDETEWEETANQLMGILRDEYETCPRLILGSIVDGFGHLGISYNDACRVLERERRPFREMMVRDENDEKRELLFGEVFQEFKTIMIENLGDAEQVFHAFDRFCTAVESYNLSAKYAQHCCFELASMVCFGYMRDSGSQPEENLNALLRSFNGLSRQETCQVTGGFLRRLLAKNAGDNNELVRKVKCIIHDKLGEDLTVAGLAAELYVTPNYLSRLFKRSTGEGCNEYIVRKRIEKAKLLLETTSLKIGEIAAMVGYLDINYFSLAFKKHTGLPPTKYRDQIQNAR